MDIEMFGQLLPEQANAPDSATTYGFAGPVTSMLLPLLSDQLIPNLGRAIKGPYSGNLSEFRRSRPTCDKARSFARFATVFRWGGCEWWSLPASCHRKPAIVAGSGI